MTIPYEARGPETFLKAGVIAFPNGKVLIQYDPVEGWLSGGPDACDIQAAKIELWFERSPFPRYSDQWEAFPSQFPRWPWPGQLDADSGEDTELLEFYHLYNGTDEEKLNKYKDHLKLQMERRYIFNQIHVKFPSFLHFLSLMGDCGISQFSDILSGQCYRHNTSVNPILVGFDSDGLYSGIGNEEFT
ncbi:hypothetical protein SNOG_01820 [Parastagonospora nodorum SN15]|uniref:Uncharacterized protein n=1 Tax=Phaeosphaeria nodorum (strain SN15 / ATCC MYA-4574 / FGSC 10173) TaxID=321614 RepID=Q0V2E4_PHANO|nr:hypothetical protein SNOG_01820 [Parastagonospora nodorum SN15]EAT91469.2 hypothetical protein SNOG_01820 [Parastagonospora nodorum SN15]